MSPEQFAATRRAFASVFDDEPPLPNGPEDYGRPSVPGTASPPSGQHRSAERIQLIPFNEIKLSTDRRDLVKGIIPRVGPTVVWGKPKCGKSFWLFDCLMHVALGWEYRGRRVDQGPVVYCAFEGQKGLEARVEAYRLAHLDGHTGFVPFYLQPVTLNLVKDHQALIKVISERLGETKPVAIALDTLNRSLPGSESSDEDMTAYVHAVDALRETFECAVPIVHHCGIDGTRPRGHTSLTGSAEAQLEVKRDAADRVVVTVELAKDGPQGLEIVSTLEVLTVGKDIDGEEITSCVVRPFEGDAMEHKASEPKLNDNQKAMLRILADASPAGLSIPDWNARCRDQGISLKRPAAFVNDRGKLKDKNLVREYMGIWHVQTRG